MTVITRKVKVIGNLGSSCWWQELQSWWIGRGHFQIVLPWGIVHICGQGGCNQGELHLWQTIPGEGLEFWLGDERGGIEEDEVSAELGIICASGWCHFSHNTAVQFSNNLNGLHDRSVYHSRCELYIWSAQLAVWNFQGCQRTWALWILNVTVSNARFI